MRLGLGLGLSGGGLFNPAILFANGEQGAMFFPSPATCFTDTGRTTPAAVGDAVAGMTDLSGRGNHASQSTSGSRPILRQSGFLYYLEFDGTDDAMATGNIDLSAVDKVMVCAGIRKTSDAAFAVLAGFDGSGRFILSAPRSNPDKGFGFISRGAGSQGDAIANSSSFNAPFTAVATGLGDISGDSSIIRVNGIQQASAATDQGAGNYGTTALSIGRRADTSAPFTGYLYGLIMRAGSIETGLLNRAERYTAAKAGIGI